MSAEQPDWPDLRRYHNDPVFHAKVEAGAQAIIQRWQRGSVLNRGATARAWEEAALLAHTVLTAIDGIVAVHPADREPQPSDGPDYHHDHAAWVRRQPPITPIPSTTETP